MPRLIFYRAQEALLEYPLRGSRAVIGRSDAADIVVPNESISRVHCWVEPRGTGWLLVDRSRHGTAVNGRPVTETHPLCDGDTIELGEFSLRYTTADSPDERTASVRSIAAEPAEAFVAREGALTIALPTLEVTRGPAAGTRIRLERRAQTVGGPGSDVVLADPSLRRGHVRIALRRGRPMLLQGSGPAYLDGARVREPLPVYPGEAVRIGETWFTLNSEERTCEERASSLGEMVAVSPAMQRLFGELKRMARGPDPLLLIGESGTGKELAARAVHLESGRPGPFVPVNCGAIPATLIESELFGHEKGAFTGADRRRDGAFQRADGGTLFLDELGELSEQAQIKLLRALDSGGIRRVGSGRVEYPDVRVISATNRDLDEAISEGRFRRDLFFRLAVLAVHLPPLRERLEDLPVLSRAIAERLGQQRGVRVTVSEEVLRKLRQHDWPGNVRELRNVLTRALVLGGPSLHPQAITFSPWSFPQPPPAPGEPDRLSQHQRQLLAEALRRHGGNRSAVARELGIARSTLHYKLRRFGLI